MEGGRATLGAMKHHILGHVAASLLVSTWVVGCKKDEPPPPLPTAQPVATNPAPLQLKPEDAGVKMPPPDAGAKKKVMHGGGSSGGLSACCSALQQNSASAPEPTKTYMMQAAQLCKAVAAQGGNKSAFGGMLMNALRGAGVPVACK